MTEQNRPYVDPAIEPGDQGTEPWADGESPAVAAPGEPSPADQFTGDASAGLDQGSADDRPAEANATSD